MNYLKALGSKIAALTSRFSLRVFSLVSTYLFVIAVTLIVWKGGWAEAHEGLQLNFLGYSLYGALFVWALSQISVIGAISDLSFKAGPVEGSVDFEDEEKETPHVARV